MSKGNPWLDEDEIPASRNGSSRWGDGDDFEDFDPNKDYVTQVVKQRESNMLDSTMNSLRLLDESERVGVASGEELVRQREVLERSEKKLDAMEKDLKESDRHLRSIKSMWGAFMNKFSKEPEPSPKPRMETKPSTGGSSRLQDAMVDCDRSIDARTSGSLHPALERQERNRQQFYNEQVTADKPRSSEMEQVEENLSMMGNSLSRLKNLAMGLGAEIDSQNPLIDRVHEKTIRVDEKIHKTNKEMIKLNHS